MRVAESVVTAGLDFFSSTCSLESVELAFLFVKLRLEQAEKIIERAIILIVVFIKFSIRVLVDMVSK